jgi:hypothetical protein
MPVLFLQGNTTSSEIEAIETSCGRFGPRSSWSVPGSDHLFTEKTGLVEEAIGEWLQNLP